MNVKSVFMCLVVSSIILSGCSSDEKTLTREEREALAARVGDWTLSKQRVKELLDGMSPDRRAQYDTPLGRAELADNLIQEELYYREGMKMGLQDDEEIVTQVTTIERSMVIAKYYNEQIKPLAYPTEELTHDYYEDNLDRFTSEPIARAMHIQVKDDPDRLRKYKAMVEAKEATFTELAQKYSADEMTRWEGGDLGYFNPGGYMRGIGYSDELSEAVFAMQVGEISEPIRWKEGWSIVVVTEMRPSVVRPFEEVREDIRERLVAPKINRVKKVAYEELRSKYPVDNFLADDAKLVTRTPEELWNLAQNSSDSYERLRYYQEIVDKYSDSSHAPKAMFMVGFVHAEELQDISEAERAFTKVLRLYPDSEVAESAEYMLKTMRTPGPALSNPGEPDEDTEESGD
jgi:peptidyl-prolyl cis-trans isomerase C